MDEVVQKLMGEVEHIKDCLNFTGIFIEKVSICQKSVIANANWSIIQGNRLTFFTAYVCFVIIKYKVSTTGNIIMCFKSKDFQIFAPP